MSTANYGISLMEANTHLPITEIVNTNFFHIVVAIHLPFQISISKILISEVIYEIPFLLTKVVPININFFIL